MCIQQDFSNVGIYRFSELVINESTFYIFSTLTLLLKTEVLVSSYMNLCVEVIVNFFLVLVYYHPT